jgi:hypothetical protein
VKPSRRQLRNLTDFERKTGWKYLITCTKASAGWQRLGFGPAFKSCLEGGFQIDELERMRALLAEARKTSSTAPLNSPIAPPKNESRRERLADGGGRHRRARIPRPARGNGARHGGCAGDPGRLIGHRLP